MRLHTIVNNITLILYCTVFQLSPSICKIIAFDKGVSLVNARVLGIFLFEYRYKSYITKISFLD